MLRTDELFSNASIDFAAPLLLTTRIVTRFGVGHCVEPVGRANERVCAPIRRHGCRNTCSLDSNYFTHLCVIRSIT